MPKTPTDYSKNIIYKIVCDDLSVKDCYVGHTTNMTKRKWNHKTHCNNEKDKYYNLKIYKIIRQNGGWDNWNMVLVEKFPCKDSSEACRREREVYEELDAKMNTLRPYRTQEDDKKYDKEYREEHKEELKKYREEHKEYHKQYCKQYYQERKADQIQNRKQYYQEHKAEIVEKKKQYYQDHKADLKQYEKLYREEHKEKIKEKVECKYCAKLLSKQYMSRHHKTCKSKPVKE